MASYLCMLIDYDFWSFQNDFQLEGVEMGSESEIKWISQLLQLSEDWLKQALTMKVTVSHFECIIIVQLYNKSLERRNC